MVWSHLFVLIGCTIEPAPPPEPGPHWQPRTDAELARALRDTCEASVRSGKPILLEFSAPWCIDCRRLEHLERDEGLSRAYEGWHRLRIDVGRFDRHDGLREAFGVRAIAHWSAVRPTDCSAEAASWPRLKQEVMELETGSTGPRSADELVRWLADARQR